MYLPGIITSARCRDSSEVHEGVVILQRTRSFTPPVCLLHVVLRGGRDEVDVTVSDT